MTFFDVYFNKGFVGKLHIDQAMRMSFSYDDEYIQNQGESISLTIPVDIKHHKDDVVKEFINGNYSPVDIKSAERILKITQTNHERVLEALA